MSRASVTVMIAAYNAAETIAVAIQSALDQPETGEVIIVDDCSQDETLAVAAQVGRNDPRVRILQQEVNQGPAAARNRAVAASEMPYVAILDADDRLLPGRFARLLSDTDWDFCADNIAFLTDRMAFEKLTLVANPYERTGFLALETFLLGNQNTSRVERSELGFLKPLMRRDFLYRKKLHYPADCRLGEDFLLYATALARGARFRLYDTCGYAAHERPNSLSGNHSVDDLRRFLIGLDTIANELPASALHALNKLRNTLRHKIDHREVLDVRRDSGILRGLFALGSRHRAMPRILRDKLRRSAAVESSPRLLISPRDFDRIVA